jgi:D-serine deaminase-like pyridoxal phosphate-dependent protein
MNTTLDTIPTPALVVDEAVALHNIAKLADYGRQHNLRIRPHTKTHKSLRIAKAQMKAGANGLTVAKVGEAEVMAEAGDDILIAYPALDPARTARIAALAKHKMVRVGIDSSFAADALGEAARRAGVTVGVLVDLDVGFHRTGVQSPEDALKLAQRVSNTKGLRLDGIMFFPGHLQWIDNSDTQIRPINDMLDATLALWKRHGLEAKVVSGGSTPSMFASHRMPTLTEIRPGTYVYFDRNCIIGKWCEPQDIAARVICTVVSDAVPGKVVLDAGNKTLTSDRVFNDLNGGFGLILEYPQAKITRLSEEHGEVDLSQSDRRPKLGERVSVVPNHICPCVNLQESAYVKRSDGTLERLDIEAKGKLS